MNMKKSLFIGLVAALLVACGGNANKQNQQTAETAEAAVQVIDESTVYVYYFHGKQRCKTCVAVEKVAKETIEQAYADNKEVRFVEISMEDKANASLVEKYEVTWNALIIARGDSHVEITKQAFANAVNSPEVLAELITEEVNKRVIE